jgi:hypothetical protein
VSIIRRLDSLAREHTERAIEIITDIMNDGMAENRERLAAAREILDRGHGKPLAATIALPASRRQIAELAALSDEELEAAIQQHQLPRLVKASVIEHHQAAMAFDHDPLLD